MYAVHWLDRRIFEVRQPARTDVSLIFSTARHDDIFCHEVVR